MSEGPVRPGRPSDYDESQVVFEEAEQLHRAALPHVFRAPEATFPPRALFEEWLSDIGTAVFVVEFAGECAGFCVVRETSLEEGPLQHHRAVAHVDLLAVHSDAQGRGLGSRLMTAVEEWARSRGLDAVDLNVWEFNEAARRFYEALGYETASRVMEHRL